jgi:hypothetical protein
MQPFKITWIGTILGLMFVIMPSVAKANDPDICFMVTSSGKKISLGEMCKVKQSAETVKQPTVLRIPIKRRAAKTPIIDVRFNGNQVFEMVFDTGASGILITQQMSNVLKLKAGEKIKASIADGSLTLPGLKTRGFLRFHNLNILFAQVPRLSTFAQKCVLIPPVALIGETPRPHWLIFWAFSC